MTQFGYAPPSDLPEYSFPSSRPDGPFRTTDELMTATYEHDAATIREAATALGLSLDAAFRWWQRDSVAGPAWVNAVRQRLT